MSNSELTARQKRFVREYLLCGDAAEAAECAGYAPGKAAETGEKLLTMPSIQKYRREQEQKLFDDMGISSAWIGRRLVEIVDRCMQGTPHMARNPDSKKREPDGVWEFDPTGAMRALHELDAHLATLREEGQQEEEGFEAWLERQGKESGL